MVLVLDAHASSLRFLRQLRDWKLEYPDAICAIDDAQKAILVAEFPELENRITVTGQPIYDKFAVTHDKDGKNIGFDMVGNRQAVRSVLKEKGLEESDKLVTITLSPPPEGLGVEKYAKPMERVIEIAKALGRIPEEKRKNIVVTLRKHPKDPVPEEEYVAVLNEHGVRTISSGVVTETDHVVAASDALLNIWSTTGQLAVTLGVPTVFVVDKKFPPPPDIYAEAPSSQKGIEASEYCEDTAELSGIVEDILDPTSARSLKLKKNMKQFYQDKNTGKNAENVANVIRRVAHTR